MGLDVKDFKPSTIISFCCGNLKSFEIKQPSDLEKIDQGA